MAKHQPDAIRKRLIERVLWQSGSPVIPVAAEFGITRQAVQKHLHDLVHRGEVASSGRGAHLRYQLVELESSAQTFELTRPLAEDDVWRTVVGPLAKPGTREGEICQYGTTEMVNNAIDHSAARSLTVSAARTAAGVRIRVVDDGVGIFERIASSLGLQDPRQSILELSKGKFTTDPARHTGEGIFFTSRAFDRFRIQSGPLYFLRSRSGEDWVVGDDREAKSGTSISMDLIVPTQRRLKDVFDEFTSGRDDYSFSKTHVPLKLAEYGDEQLISRSQAKRVLARVDRFEEVTFDFAGVGAIGPAFADEIFRVFANQYPRVKMTAVHANEEIRHMLQRAVLARDGSRPADDRSAT